MSKQPYGLMAQFEDSDTLVAAARAAREAGYCQLEAYAPFPVPGLADAVGFRERRVPKVALVCGLLAAAGAFFMQWYAAVPDYPYVTGGKPLNSWPAFLPITFEVGILTVVLSALITMLVLNGLPRPYHAAFNDPEFDRASGDGFFLLCCPQSIEEARALLERQGAQAVRKVAP
ncbi:DUF3341 domain-containing protein [Marinobacteraceae bacterium S3BR75-40.1]